MQKIALVLPDTPDGNYVPSLGLLTMAAVLENDGHDVCIVDQHIDAHLVRTVEDFKPNLVGISAVTSAILSGKQIATQLKQVLPGLKIVFGGPHPSALPREVIGWPEADFVIVHEGERPLQMLSQWLDSGGRPDQLAQIPNLYYKARGGPQFTFPAPLLSIEELTHLPLPAYHLIDPEKAFKRIRHGLFRQGKRILPYMASRGCPQRCTFCCRMMGTQVRRKPPELVLRDIEYLLNRYGLDEIYMEDDNFTSSREYALAVLNGIVSRRLPIKLKFANGLRIDTLCEELLDKMRQAGCNFIGFGLESGSSSVLKLMQKDLRLEQVRSKVSLVRSFGFLLGANMILGYPGETEQDIWESYAFFKSLQLDSVAVVNLIPFPGTAVRTICEQNAYLTPLASSWDNYYFDIRDPKILIETEWLSEAQLRELIRKILLKFYVSPRRVMTLLNNMSMRDLVEGLAMMVHRIIR